jgi:hypothetical protein
MASAQVTVLGGRGRPARGHSVRGMRNRENRALSVICLLVLAALAGPYPTVAGLAETAAGLAGRALLTAGTVWLAITLLRPRGRTPEVTR